MPETSAAPTPRPHVDPGDLLILFIRFIAANFLICVAAYCLLRHFFTFAAILAVIAALTQRAAIILYRQMRDDYAAAQAEILQGTMPTDTEAHVHGS